MSPCPKTPSHLPPHPTPRGAPALGALFHASNLDWSSISHMVIYMFQCYSLKSSRPRLLPQSTISIFFASRVPTNIYPGSSSGPKPIVDLSVVTPSPHTSSVTSPRVAKWLVVNQRGTHSLVCRGIPPHANVGTETLPLLAPQPWAPTCQSCPLSFPYVLFLSFKFFKKKLKYS